MNTYYESAEGTMITRKRALQELREHGVIQQSDEFFRDLGDKPEYDAQEVLNWLGY